MNGAYKNLSSETKPIGWSLFKKSFHQTFLPAWSQSPLLTKQMVQGGSSLSIVCWVPPGGQTELSAFTEQQPRATTGSGRKVRELMLGWSEAPKAPEAHKSQGYFLKKLLSRHMQRFYRTRACHNFCKLVPIVMGRVVFRAMFSNRKTLGRKAGCCIFDDLFNDRQLDLIDLDFFSETGLQPSPNRQARLAQGYLALNWYNQCIFKANNDF